MVKNEQLHYRHNSTMVRFKLKARTALYSRMPGHNSTMVRFKPEEKQNEEYVVVGSQFHYGSIQTIRSYGRLPPIDMSQFHYGSIQTVLIHKYSHTVGSVTIPLWFDSNYKNVVVKILASLRHNSTMVRFKQISKINQKFGKSRHNSTMVRFKRNR